MSATPEFLVEGILPANEVHLLGGASGSGKTTFTFQCFLHEWQNGRDFLGHRSNAVPYSYISLDRSRASVMRTLERLNLQNEITRVICQEDIPDDCNAIGQVIEKVASIHTDSKLLVVEGYQLAAGEKGNSYNPVAQLLKRTGKICIKKQITVLGICHSPKLKSDERYSHPRESIMGSAAWGAYSDTIIVLDLNESTGIITTRVLPRNAASEQYEFVFGTNGMFEPAVRGSKKDTLRIRIASLAVGLTLMTSDIMEIGKHLGTKETTVKEVIRECVTNKVLIKIDDGMYTRSSQTPLHKIEQEDFTVEA
jgi:RecA-family ATPase